MADKVMHLAHYINSGNDASNYLLPTHAKSAFRINYSSGSKIYQGRIIFPGRLRMQICSAINAFIFRQESSVAFPT
jgi:hypothetical protein